MPIMKPPKGVLLNRGHPLARGLVGYWLLNEASGTIVNDLSGNGLNLTMIGNATWDVGKFGPCMYCPSRSDDVASMVYPYPGPAAAFTVSGWLRCAADPGFQTILSWGADNTSLTKGLWFAVDAYSGSAKARILLYTSRAAAVSVDGPYATNDNKWHHYAATWDGATITYYLDGAAWDTDAMSGALAYTAASDPYLCLGSVENGAGNGVTGWLDVVAIYKRALTPPEIAELYRNPFGMVRRSRIELWVPATQGGAPPAVVPCPYYSRLMAG